MKTRRHNAFVLAAVLVLTILSSMVAVGVLFRLRAEETASAASGRGEQAWLAAMSGISQAIEAVAHSTPGSLDWRDDPASFKDRLVFDDGGEHWYFSIYSLGEPENAGDVRFGMTDEASKLNVNQAKEEMLLKLPGITPYIAHSLLDFLDRDNIPHPEGAEQEYYDTLPKPYRIFNGPLSSCEELLLARGFTTALLYGEDANLNCRLDPNEDNGADTFPPDNKDGKLDPGLRHYLTVWSYDLNEDNEAAPRMNINEPGENFHELPEALTAYIAALRRNNVKLGHPADLLEAKATLKDEKGKNVETQSGVTKAGLATVLDKLTTAREYFLPGLININTASTVVLQTLPGVEMSLAEAIVSTRRHLRPEQQRTAAWLYQEDLLNAGAFKKLAPFITTRGYQYHLQVAGYGIPSGRYRVVEATIDLGRSKPMITYLRDITRFGMPFKIDLAQEAPDA